MFKTLKSYLLNIASSTGLNEEGQIRVNAGNLSFHDGVSEVIVGGGAGTDLFEIEANRWNAAVSTNHASPTTVTFSTPFSEPPLVVCTIEGDDYTQCIMVVTVTTTGFTCYGNSAKPFCWIASKAGTYETSPGVIFQSGTANINGVNVGSIEAYQTGLTPAIVGSSMQTDDDANSCQFSIANRMIGGHLTADTNYAGRSSSVQVVVPSGYQTAGNSLSFLLVSQTCPTKFGNSISATGSKGDVGGLEYECGSVMGSTLTDGDMNYAAFSAPPSVIVSGESRNDNVASSGYSTVLKGSAGAPGVSSFQITSGTTDDRVGYCWIAMEIGHGTVNTAKRLR
jgi:hypothetical protein